MIAQSITDSTKLNNNVEMPWLGLNTWQMDNNNEVENAVIIALEIGYRSFDTATIYRNERGIGEAIKDSGIPREDIFLTSIVWNSEQGYNQTLRAFTETLKNLETDYLDLYLIHWPVSGRFNDTWKAIEKLYKEKLIRAIGVSSLMINHLEELESNLEIKPMVNQIEFHPYLTQPKLFEYCISKNIQVEAWSPLMQGNINNISIIDELSVKYGKSNAQIILRWHLQRKVIVIPKSSNKKRIKENSGIFDFELSVEEIERLNSLNKNKRFGPDPNNFNF